MFRKWFNQSAEIKRLQGQIKHLQGELNISNDAVRVQRSWKKTALVLLQENSTLKNGIQSCIDCETPRANGSTKYIIKKLRGLL